MWSKRITLANKASIRYTFDLVKKEREYLKSQLKKEITFFGALSTVMGTVIGAGVFFKAAAVVQHTQSSGLTLLVWLIAGCLTICGGLTVAELATAIPETGGPIRYIERIYGKLPSFLLGWAQKHYLFPCQYSSVEYYFCHSVFESVSFARKLSLAAIVDHRYQC